MGLISKGSKKLLLEKAKFLADNNEDYTIKVVNGNYELISNLFNHKTLNKTSYSTPELQFIKSVKHYLDTIKINQVTRILDQLGNRVTGYPDYFPLAR